MFAKSHLSSREQLHITVGKKKTDLFSIHFLWKSSPFFSFRLLDSCCPQIIIVVFVVVFVYMRAVIIIDIVFIIIIIKNNKTKKKVFNDGVRCSKPKVTSGRFQHFADRAINPILALFDSNSN